MSLTHRLSHVCASSLSAPCMWTGKWLSGGKHLLCGMRTRWVQIPRAQVKSWTHNASVCNPKGRQKGQKGKSRIDTQGCLVTSTCTHPCSYRTNCTGTQTDRKTPSPQYTRPVPSQPSPTPHNPKSHRTHKNRLGLWNPQTLPQGA